MHSNEIITLQPELTQRLLSSVKHGQLAHAYLFEGEKGTGKKELAFFLAKAGLCLTPNEGGSPCETCNNCLRIEESNHPDIVYIEPDGLSIKVDQVRDLKAEFSKSSVESTSTRYFIIEDVEKMTVGAANSLLKFLEEPDGNTHAFLLTTAKNHILPTILSRCQLVSFYPFAKEKLLEQLKNQGIPENKAALWVHLTNSLQTAVEMEQDEWFNEARRLIWKLFQLSLAKDEQAFIMIQSELMPQLKDRKEQQIALDMWTYAYRDLLMMAYGNVSLLAFPSKQQDYEGMLHKYSGRVVNQQLELVLKAKRKLESNVGAQGVFEQIVLNII